MFGSKKIQELEARVSELQSKLTQTTDERNGLSQQLQNANARVAELEARLNDFDLEALKEEARASKAEYEGLKALYHQKNQEFDDAIEEREQDFARDQAAARHNLENEIRDNRQANQDYVARTVRTFGESYNYYLNQIKLLMDALGNVAFETGEALFAGENDDLKSRFADQMRDTLKTRMGSLESGTGDAIVIGAEDKCAPVPQEADAEEPAEEDAY